MSLTELTRIGSTFAKHSLGGALARIGLGAHVPFFSRGQSLPLDAPQKLGRALSELGGLYSEFADFLSMRSDLVSPEFARALSNTSSHGIAHDPHLVFNHAFGRRTSELFAHIDSVLIDSSPLLVHAKARLTRGDSVIVRAHAPLDSQHSLELDTLRVLAQKLHGKLGVSTLALLSEFEQHLVHKRDLHTQARMFAELRQHAPPFVVIPQIHSTHSSERVLTLEHLDGVSLLDSPSLAKERAAPIIANAFTHYLSRGFAVSFAAQHLLNAPARRFGVQHAEGARLTKKESVQNLLKHVLAGDPHETAKALLSLSHTSPRNVPAFVHGCEQALAHAALSQQLAALAHTSSAHSLALSHDVIDVAASLHALESTITQLSPTFDIVAYLKEHFNAFPDHTKHLNSSHPSEE